MGKSITIIQEVMPDMSRVTLPESDSEPVVYKAGDYVQSEITISKSKRGQRSMLMNRCVHKYCSNIANTLNEYGIEQVIGMAGENGKRIEMCRPWVMSTVKTDIFQVQLLGVTGGRTHHTSEATNAELCETDEAIGKLLAENFGLVIEWPSNKPPIWRG